LRRRGVNDDAAAVVAAIVRESPRPRTLGLDSAALRGARARRHVGVRTAVRADVDEHVLEEGHPKEPADAVGGGGGVGARLAAAVSTNADAVVDFVLRFNKFQQPWPATVLR
jgi:hypothetical protein